MKDPIQMTDAFDTFAKDQFNKNWDNLKPAEKKPIGMTPAAQRKLFERIWKDKWLTFIHPVHGKVAAQCLEAKFTANDGRKYPVDDYNLKVQGRTGAILEITLLKNEVQFHDTKEQAVAETKTQ